MTADRQSSSAPRVAVIGGGLAGLAAAAALAERGCAVELFEARRTLGGRATSFHDPQSDELVDHCQHVSMGCCTNLADFARRTGIAELFRRNRVLHFFGPDGRCFDLAAASWLPAPLHLGPALWRMKYLSVGERVSIARAMWRLARMPLREDDRWESIGAWLKRNAQSQRAIERFWSVVLVSALGEELDRASLKYARQVFVEGFMATRDGYVVEVPEVPLGVLYGERLQRWLADRGVVLHLATPITEICGDAARVTAVLPRGREPVPCDFAISALPWRKWPALLTGALRAVLVDACQSCKLGSSPITGLHLWFDRPITSLPHAVLVDRLSQWVFNRGHSAAADADPMEHYYQVVISASRSLEGRRREEVVAEICDELRRIWPEAAEAKLLRWRLVTENEAVFSAAPGVDRIRSAQRTAVPNLVLAGDWTATGWPSTMEGAVRSGYLAAEAVLRAAGRPEQIVVPNLRRGFLSRMLLGEN